MASRLTMRNKRRKLAPLVIECSRRSKGRGLAYMEGPGRGFGSRVICTEWLAENFKEFSLPVMNPTEDYECYPEQAGDNPFRITLYISPTAPKTGRQNAVRVVLKTFDDEESVYVVDPRDGTIKNGIYFNLGYALFSHFKFEPCKIYDAWVWVEIH